MNKTNGNLSLLDFLKNVIETSENGEIGIFRELTRLTSEDKAEYQRLLSGLEITNKADIKTHSTAVKGKALEDIVAFIISHCGKLFTVYKNLYTSTNELDQLIKLTDIGRLFWGARLIDSVFGEYFIGECKNYSGKIGVSWVGKLCSLTMATNCKLAILFSYHGVSGNGWKDACGLVKKIHMLKERNEDKIYIISFSKDDFDLIGQGTSFLELIETKILALRTDTDFTSFITAHPAQESS